MRRRTLLATCVGALSGLAGCLGNADGHAGTESPAESPSPSPTPSPPPESAVVDYESLTRTQQRAFERARNETVRLGGVPPDVDVQIDYGIGASVPFRNHEYVRKDGTYYELSVQGSGFIGATGVVVEPVDAAGNETVHRLGEMNGPGVDLIVRAIEGGGRAVRADAEPPDSIAAGDAVRYRGELYRVTQVSNRDFEYFTMEVDPRD